MTPAIAPPSENGDNGPPFLSAQIIIPTIACTSTILGGFFFYREFLRRIPTSPQLPDRFLKRRTLLGYVTSVGDPDNFRFFHTPGGRLAGWGWLRPLPKINQRGLGSQTLSVRLNGVDAPEMAHFGKPAQEYSDEALDWLRKYILGRRVRILPLAKDQYQRTVCEAKVWKWTGRKNISEEMLRNGWATIYEAKSGAQFNGHKAKFLGLEAEAKKKRKGIFQKGTKNFESPREYKQKHSN